MSAPAAPLPRLSTPSAGRPALAGLRLEELAQLLDSRARAVEVIRWLHAGADAAGPNISARSWTRLREQVELPHAEVLERSVSADGTTKYLFGFSGAQVETVRIPIEDRTTLCVSSQSGCTRNCQFCATATLGFGRNLRADEILTQFLLAAREAPPEAPVRNVVFMGMGEPMDNLDEVLRAVELLTQSPAPQLRAERVTVSTSGVLPGMVRFLAESTASLALSLNATTNEQRRQIMPHTRTWPIEALLEALREEAKVHPRRLHFIEYVMFDGFNDSDEDAARLVTLLEGVPARVNLIPHNHFLQNRFRSSSEERVRAFQSQVVRAGIRCMVRRPRGADVAAACGQLRRDYGERVSEEPTVR